MRSTLFLGVISLLTGASADPYSPVSAPFTPCIANPAALPVRNPGFDNPTLSPWVSSYGRVYGSVTADSVASRSHCGPRFVTGYVRSSSMAARSIGPFVYTLSQSNVYIPAGTTVHANVWGKAFSGAISNAHFRLLIGNTVIADKRIAAGTGWVEFGNGHTGPGYAVAGDYHTIKIEVSGSALVFGRGIFGIDDVSVVLVKKPTSTKSSSRKVTSTTKTSSSRASSISTSSLTTSLSTSSLTSSTSTSSTDTLIINPLSTATSSTSSLSTSTSSASTLSTSTLSTSTLSTSTSSLSSSSSSTSASASSVPSGQVVSTFLNAGFEGSTLDPFVPTSSGVNALLTLSSPVHPARSGQQLLLGTSTSAGPFFYSLTQSNVTIPSGSNVFADFFGETFAGANNTRFRLLVDGQVVDDKTVVGASGFTQIGSPSTGFLVTGNTHNVTIEVSGTSSAAGQPLFGLDDATILTISASTPITSTSTSIVLSLPTISLSLPTISSTASSSSLSSSTSTSASCFATAAVYLANPSFETQNTTTFWNFALSGTSILQPWDSLLAHNGNRFSVLDSTQTGPVSAVYSQNITAYSGSTIDTSFWVKPASVAPGVGLNIVVDGNTVASLNTTAGNTAWVQISASGVPVTGDTHVVSLVVNANVTTPGPLLTVDDASVTTSGSSTNLLLNAGFDQSTVAPWVVFGSNFYHQSSVAVAAHEGSRSVTVASYNPGTVLWTALQNLALPAGASANASIWVKPDTGAPAVVFQLLLDGLVLASLTTTPGTSAYQQLSASNITAIGDTHTLALSASTTAPGRTPLFTVDDASFNVLSGPNGLAVC